MCDRLSGADTPRRTFAPDPLTYTLMPPRTEEEIQQSAKAVADLSVHIVTVCEAWAYQQPMTTTHTQDCVLAECVTAVLQVGLTMAARMGLPAEKLLELYRAECAECAAGTPDRNAN